jgi:DNA-binding NtrC family response regulator
MARPPHAVLVVEDEMLIRMDLADSLQRRGFAVFEAGSAVEAIQILEREPTIRVVFTDIQMPGDMDGVALSHYVRQRWPPTIIVVSSGNAHLATTLPTNVAFLVKPFNSAALDREITNIVRRLAA